MWLAVSGFMVMGLVFGLSLANHSDWGSLLVVHTLFSQDGYQWEGFWEVVGHVVSPFDLCGTLLIDGGLLVLCSLPGPPVLKQGRQISYYGPWPGWGISVNVLPLTKIQCFFPYSYFVLRTQSIAENFIT